MADNARPRSQLAVRWNTYPSNCGKSAREIPPELRTEFDLKLKELGNIERWLKDFCATLRKVNIFVFRPGRAAKGRVRKAR